MEKSQNPTGLSVQSEPPVDSSRIGFGGVVSRSWMSDELVQETRKVWAQAYGRDVPDDEAMEILMNVKRLAEALVKIQRSQ